MGLVRGRLYIDVDEEPFVYLRKCSYCMYIILQDGEFSEWDYGGYMKEFTPIKHGATTLLEILHA